MAGRPGSAGAPAAPEQFIKLAERISGQDLDAFFQAWLYSPTKPELGATADSARVAATAAAVLYAPLRKDFARR
jgi:aminopeptidase N